MIPAWTLIPAIGISAIFGFVLCLACYVVIVVLGTKKRPMAAAPWTAEELKPDSVEQLIRDINRECR